MKTTRLPFLMSWAAFFAGCSGENPPPVTAPIATSPEPPIATAVASALASASAAAAPAEPPAEKVPLFVAADGFDRRVTIHPIAGATLISSYHFLGELKDGAIASRPELIAGADKAFESATIALGGRWPDAAWIGVNDDESLTRWSVKAFHRRGAKWVDGRPREPLGPLYSAVSAWSGGRVIALRNDLTHGKFVVDMLDGAKTALPEPGQLPSGQSRLLVHGGVALESGEVLAFGWAWGASEDRLAVERWAPGAKHGTFDELPIPEGTERAWPWGLHVRAPNEAYLAATLVKKGGETAPYLARFDGASWSPVRVPVDRDLYAVAGAPDGTLCVLGRGKLDDAQEAEAWCRPEGGAWRRLVFAESRIIPRQIWPRSAADVWVSALLPASAQSPTPNVLLRTTAPASVFHAPPSGQRERELDPYRPPIPGTPSCAKLFALLFTLSKASPADYDFPSTRAALKGHVEYASARFIEAEERGKRYFGAIVPNYELGTKLVALVKGNVAGSSPQLLCRDPPARRVLPIDLVTGELKKN